ncbi:MAG: hypothetical protein ER33_00780 [Cyanobium sp. CACIAM 14]|nr:MAG: hypothetical protein ER33_00780 [Cyanobium sp. CACIAM 14]
MGPGRMGGWVHVPESLPAPRNPEWLRRLKGILALERESLGQYESDQARFHAPMPYGMVIAQEANHIRWIEGLMTAYGLTSPAKSAPVLIRNGSLAEAYKVARKMEADLLPRYEWLVRNAEDGDTAQVLNAILLQSRWHLALFEHALRMGQGVGFRRGAGMMGGADAGF